MLAHLCNGFLLKRKYDLSDPNLKGVELQRMVLVPPPGSLLRHRVVALSGSVKDRIPVLRKAL